MKRINQNIYLKFELDGFNKTSKRFFWRDTRINFLLELVNREFKNKPRPIYIVDIGCGPGVVVSRLAKQGYNVTGLDKEAKFIDYAKKICRMQKLDVNFLVRDLENELNLEKKFDCIICTEVIEHLKQPEKILEKMSSLLKKNGILIISTPNYNSSWPLIELMSKLVLRSANWMHYHINKFNPKSISSLVKKYNFEKIKVYSIFLLSPFLPSWLAYKFYNIEKRFLNKFMVGELIYIVCVKK